jgi:hypothetical protein
MPSRLDEIGDTSREATASVEKSTPSPTYPRSQRSATTRLHQRNLDEALPSTARGEGVADGLVDAPLTGRVDRDKLHAADSDVSGRFRTYLAAVAR